MSGHSDRYSLRPEHFAMSEGHWGSGSHFSKHRDHHDKPKFADRRNIKVGSETLLFRKQCCIEAGPCLSSAVLRQCHRTKLCDSFYLLTLPKTFERPKRFKLDFLLIKMMPLMKVYHWPGPVHEKHTSGMKTSLLMEQHVSLN